MLARCEVPLCEAYDLAMLDLDGVVYVGGEGVAGAAEHLAAVRDTGMRTAYVTNNASRPPAAVAARLTGVGVPARPEEVVTSAQAAARLLRERLGAGARVALLGATGLAEALTEERLLAVSVGDEAAVALVTGYGPDVRWAEVMRAAVRVRDGLWWVASNTDHTIPTGFGVAPGHGVLVDTIRRFAGVDPVVAGKPQPPLLRETIRRVGGRRPLMVGDRLDTDIVGARNAGVDSLLVLTGVTGLGELVSAGPQLRPTYLSPDLGGLRTRHPVPDLDAQGVATPAVASLGGWRAAAPDGRLEVSGRGCAADWWRVVATAAWAHLDARGTPVEVGGLPTPPR